MRAQGARSGDAVGGAGARVRVLERQSQVGGRTSTLSREGFRFDLGPTFFLYPRVLEEIFAAVGRDLHEEVELIKLDPQYRLIFGGGGELLATPDVGRMERAISLLSARDGAEFRRFVADNRRKMNHFRAILESPFLSWRDLLSPRFAAMLPVLRPWRSLDDELRHYFADERIRLAMTFQSKYLGMSPFNCPSLFSVLAFIEYEYGVFHPVGGCGAVSQAMVARGGEPGAEISLDEDVEEILFEGRRAVGVRSTSGVHRADALVINADFARAMQRLVPDRLRRKWTDRRIAGKRFSCSTFMMYLGIEGRYEHLAHHTIYLRAITGRTSTTPRTSTYFPTTLLFTCRTPARTTRHLRRRACQPSMPFFPLPTNMLMCAGSNKETDFVLWLSGNWQESGCMTWRAGSDSSMLSRRMTGNMVMKSIGERRLASPTTCARCCTGGRITGLRIWARCT